MASPTLTRCLFPQCFAHARPPETRHQLQPAPFDRPNSSFSPGHVLYKYWQLGGQLVAQHPRAQSNCLPVHDDACRRPRTPGAWGSATIAILVPFAILGRQSSLQRPLTTPTCCKHSSHQNQGQDGQLTTQHQRRHTPTHRVVMSNDLVSARRTISRASTQRPSAANEEA